MSMLTLYVATPLTGAVMKNQSEIHVWRAMADDAAFVGVGLVVVVREEEGPASPDQRAVSSHVPLAHARANAPVRARLRRLLAELYRLTRATRACAGNDRRLLEACFVQRRTDGFDHRDALVVRHMVRLAHCPHEQRLHASLDESNGMRGLSLQVCQGRTCQRRLGDETHGGDLPTSSVSGWKKVGRGA